MQDADEDEDAQWCHNINFNNLPGLWTGGAGAAQ